MLFTTTRTPIARTALASLGLRMARPNYLIRDNVSTKLRPGCGPSRTVLCCPANHATLGIIAFRCAIIPPIRTQSHLLSSSELPFHQPTLLHAGSRKQHHYSLPSSGKSSRHTSVPNQRPVFYLSFFCQFISLRRIKPPPHIISIFPSWLESSISARAATMSCPKSAQSCAIPATSPRGRYLLCLPRRRCLCPSRHPSR